MRHRSAIIAGVVAVALAALVVLFATSGHSDDEQGGPADSELTGDLAPAITGTDLSGAAFDLDKLRGRWVVVNFFATWCPPCVKEHPELVRFAEEAGDRAEVVSVAFEDPPEKIEEFFAANGGDWPVLSEDTGPISIDYGVKQLPESFVIDPEGRVVEKLEGGVTAAELEEIIGMTPAPGGS